MNTDDIMRLAVRLAGQRRTPADSQVYVPSDNVRRVWCGIDADTGVLVAARDSAFDLVLAHHPLGGAASLGLLKVFPRHGEILRRHGVPKKAADAAVRAMQAEHAPRLHAGNYDHVPSMARLLGVPLMNVHNPCDEIGRQVMVATLKAAATRTSTVADAVHALDTLPEFANAETDIVVRMGRPGNRIGKWAVHHGAGTNGGYPIASAAYRHGVDTVIYIHVDSAHLRRLHEEFGVRGPRNLIVTGHIAADSIGVNRLVTALRARRLEVTCGGGVIEG